MTMAPVLSSSDAPPAVVLPAPSRAESADQATKLRELVREWRAATPRNTEDARGTPPTPRRSCPIVAITSGKGGVGKTNLAVNLSIALAESGCRVTLLDADLGLANADVLCGLTPTTRLDITLEPRNGVRRTLMQIAVAGPAGIRLIPGAVGLPRIAELPQAQREQIIAQLAEVEAESDIIVVDTGAGIGASVLSFVAAADLALVVATPEPTSIADAYAMVKASRPLQREGSKIGLIVNQASDRAEGEATHARIAGVAERFLNLRPDLIGIVREDPSVPKAVRERRPFVTGRPSSNASQDVRELARGLRERLGVGTGTKAASPKGFWSRLWPANWAR